MRDETSLFLRYLLANCDSVRQTACLTLTAMHPDRQHPCPSRHIPLNDSHALSDAMDQLFTTNACGWGGFIAVGLRRRSLGRWRRGGLKDIAALPALFVDIDDPAPETLRALRNFRPTPSCIVHSGGGYHAYWWLETPLTQVEAAASVLRALSVKLGGDSLSIAHSLRLPGTINTKPERAGARCHLVDLRDEHYPLSVFEPLVETLPSIPTVIPRRLRTLQNTFGQSLNPDLIAAMADHFAQQGYRQRGDWLNGPCIYPEQHQHGDRHSSFGFNTRTGYGFCYVCGTLLLKDLCALFGIHPATYGGLCA
ncbi:MAG: DNA-primase RepB domain-containing protein [Chloroflexota bacterium]